ncbi:hypothetical protein NUM3379_24010 [Kineococcus sp. NUM-3379]
MSAEERDRAGTPEPVVTPMTPGNWPDVRDVYAAGIASGHATFQEAAPAWEAFDAAHLSEHRLLALDESGTVLGWAAVSPVSARPVYAGVVEHSVYVSPTARGRGVGRLLLAELIASTEAAGIWTLQAGVFPENTASLALHAAAGFRVVGRRERIARMTHGPLAGRWRDTVLLERRSTLAGTCDRRTPHPVREPIEELPAVTTPCVLFVCVRNGGKSQMAAGLMREAAAGTVEVDSAGTRAGSALNALSAETMQEVGVDITDQRPKQLTDDMVRSADLVVVLGSEAHVEAAGGTPVEVWETDEPSSRGIEGAERMRLVRDDIAARVGELARRLTTGTGS